MRVSARGLRTIGKIGFDAALPKGANGEGDHQAGLDCWNGHFYTTTKNPKLQRGKLELRKYDLKVRKHVLYREAKA